MTTSIPAWPVIRIVIQDAAQGTISGRTIRITPGQDIEQHLLEQACTITRSYGRPVRVRVEAPTGITELIADPRGTTTTVSFTPHATSPTAPSPTAPSPTAQPPTPPTASPPVPRWYSIDPSLSPAGPTATAPRPEAATGPLPAPPGPSAGSFAGSFADVPDPSWNLPAQRITTRTPGRPRRVGVSLVFGTSVVISLAVLVLLVHPGEQAGGQASPPAAASPTGSGPAVAPLTPSAPSVPVMSPAEDTPSPLASAVAPAAAAPGYQARPRWTHAVAAGTQIGVGPDGLVVTRTPDGRVLGISAAGGQAQWWTRRTYPTGTAGTAGWSGPWLTRIDGQDVVALLRPGELTYWPVPTTTGPVQDASTSVVLPVGAQVVWGGSSPLVVLGPAAAAVVHAGALQLVTLPAQARPLVADGADVLAVQAATVIRARAGGTTQTSRLTPPAGVTGTPVRVEAVGTTYLVAAWPPKAGIQTVTLIEVASGRTLVTARLPAGVDITRSRTVRAIGAPLTGVGALAVDTDIKHLWGLLAQYEITGLVHGHIYATDAVGRRTVDITTTGGTFTVTPLAAGADVPLATVTPTGDAVCLALTMTSTPTGWLLHALPASRT